MADKRVGHGIGRSLTGIKLRHERHAIPDIPIAGSRPYGAACASRFGARTLRDAVDFVCGCDSQPGPKPDDIHSLLTYGTGTIGAKQALLVALAIEQEYEGMELIVACCELRLPSSSSRQDSGLRRLNTLPMAVCWIRVQDRRLQIFERTGRPMHSVNPITECPVRPEQLSVQRIGLYRTFAADWCRALEADPLEFARLRAWQLRASPGTATYENLLGYGLSPSFAPSV